MQFDVHIDPERDNRKLLNIQAAVLDRLASRIVIPLFPVLKSMQPIARLNPVLNVNGVAMVLMTHQIAPIPVKELGPVVINIDGQSDVIADALDMLLKGF
jgi:toxin CcdB